MIVEILSLVTSGLSATVGFALLCAFARESEKYLKTNFYLLLMVFFVLDAVAFVLTVIEFFCLSKFFGYVNLFLGACKVVLVFFMAVDRMGNAFKNRVESWNATVFVGEMTVVAILSAAFVVFVIKGSVGSTILGYLHVVSGLICVLTAFSYCCCYGRDLEHEVRVEKRLFWALFGYIAVQIGGAIVIVIFTVNAVSGIRSTRQLEADIYALAVNIVYVAVAVEILAKIVLVGVLMRVSSCTRNAYKIFWKCGKGTVADKTVTNAIKH